MPWLAFALVPAFLLGLRDPGARRRLYPVAVAAAAWQMWVVFIGGDIFPARRHMVPLVVLAGLWVMEGLSAVRARFVVPAAAVLLALHVRGQGKDALLREAVYERWTQYNATITDVLNRAFADADPLFATDPAGIAFWLRMDRLVDMLGLCDRTISHHPTRSGDDGLVGHTLGNGAYVWDLRPDMILMAGPWARPEGMGRFPSDQELLATPGFRDAYRLVDLIAWGDQPTFHLWYRVRSERIGVRREGETWRIPGFLLGDLEILSGFDADGRLGVFLPAGRTATLPVGDADIPADGRISVDACLGDAVVEILRAETGTTIQVAAPHGAHVHEVRVDPS